MDLRILEFCQRLGLDQRAREGLEGLLTELGVGAEPHTVHTAWVGLADEPAEPATPSGPSRAARYRDLGRIGVGATGDVRRVYDTEMQRVVAMKVLRRDLLGDPPAVARFLHESTVTAGLQHPGIVVVHDRGLTEDGRPWFTMKEVRGHTLREVLLGRGAPRWPLRRLLDAFVRLCQALAYAHREGVVHRDLKPANLMVGEFGEVLVMDWGAAVRVSELGEGRVPVIGTPGFLAPEVGLYGALPSPASDVYALGAVLGEILRGVDQPAPDELVALADRAMASDPVARPGGAAALAEAVTGWMDGARRRERALAVLSEAELEVPVIERLTAASAAASERARALLDPLEVLAPVAQKAEGWRIEDEAQALLQEAMLVEARYEQRLHTAQNIDPEAREISERLADLYRRRMEASEARQDELSMLNQRVLLEAHDRGQHRRWLEGQGALTLHTTPAGARVDLHQFREIDRRLVPVFVRELGVTPLDEVAIPRGSHLLVVQAEGHAPMHYPLVVGRLEHWHGVPPDGAEPASIPLLRHDQLGADEVYVPAGWCTVGGDPGAVDAPPATRLWIDGFVIKRQPVRNDAYLRFINEAAALLDEAAIEALLPTVLRGKDDDVRRTVYQRTADARYVLGPDGRGQIWADDLPVQQIDWRAAMAYCNALGPGWRLPHEFEWEKAVRGVDGRIWPWGRHFDANWACTVLSHRGAPERVSVDQFPDDRSPYGLLGAAGNVRDFCVNPWTRSGGVEAGTRLRVEVAPADTELYAVRGGSWSSMPNYCRPAFRYASRPGDSLSVLGFRPARPV
jgi:serine/threonine protein kinase/formylglycine-generating enzyme required for sulfatase activity